MAAKPPDEAKLYQASLDHLARYPATEASMARVLTRKLDRWARLQTAETTETADSDDLQSALTTAKRAIPAIIARLKADGVLNDSAFAASREKRLRREGKSRRYALAHLAAKGVATATAQSILPDDPDRELAAACAYLRRRRAGPFGPAPTEKTPETKTLAALARIGFSHQTAHHALRLTRDEAESLIKRLHE